MQRPLTILLLCVASLMWAPAASAQDAGSVGLTMGYPSSVGVLWHVTERVALRPEFFFNHTSTETETTTPIGIGTSSDGHSVAIGFSVLLHLAKWDTVRTYLVPRYAYTRARSSSDGPLPGLSFESTSTGHNGGLAFGGRQVFGQHFAVYGELGLSYERLRSETTSTATTGRAFGTRSGVGVVVYF